MLMFFLVLLNAAVLLCSITLLKSYRQISPKELKCRVREGDVLAEALYKVVAYGRSLDIFLWLLVGLSASTLFTLFARSMTPVVAVCGIAVFIWFGFAWLPNTQSSHLGRQVAKYVARPLHFILELLYPALNKIDELINKHRPVSIHTGMYSKDDLVALLNQQKGQLDSRISKEDLTIARNALIFGDMTVKDIYLPKRVMKTVSADDTVGPLLLEELHKSGHSRFPVYEGKKDNFVGVLYLRSIVKKRASGLVKRNMESNIFFVHEEGSLRELLQAFLKTRHHLFLVVNNFEEVVGLVTLEDVLEKIIGKPILDEFDQYDDMRAVAAKAARKEHTKNHIGEAKMLTQADPVLAKKST